MLAPDRRLAGVSGVSGGFLWAVTPLRQPIFDAGSTPDEGETFFRLYNLLIIVIAVLLTIALVRLRRDALRVTSRLFATGWWTMLAGHLLLLSGALPAVVFGGRLRSVVRLGQDLSFLGAIIAGLGAFLVGVSIVRHRRRRAGVASWLLLLALPLGSVAVVLLATSGVHEDLLGLPLTMLYGSAWVVLGWTWIRGDEAQPRRGWTSATPLGT